LRRLNQVHDDEFRSTNFPEHESVVWINQLLSKVWANFNISMEDLIMKELGKTLEEKCPPSLSSLSLKKVSVGQHPPVLSQFKIWREAETELKFDCRLDWASDLLFVVNVGKAGVVMPVQVKNLALSAHTRICAQLLPNTYPYCSSVTIQILEKPLVDVAVNALVEVTEIPGLVYFIRSTIMDIVGNLLVLPNKLDINILDLLGVDLPPEFVADNPKAARSNVLQSGFKLVGSAASNTTDAVLGVGQLGFSAISGVGNLGVSAVSSAGRVGFDAVSGAGRLGAGAVTGMGKGMGKGVNMLGKTVRGENRKHEVLPENPEKTSAGPVSSDAEQDEGSTLVTKELNSKQDKPLLHKSGKKRDAAKKSVAQTTNDPQPMTPEQQQAAATATTDPSGPLAAPANTEEKTGPAARPRSQSRPGISKTEHAEVSLNRSTSLNFKNLNPFKGKRKESLSSKSKPPIETLPEQ